MSVDDQREFYEGGSEISSDPFGIIDRNNRNHRKKVELVINATSASPGDKVLEVGCGHGLHAQHYDERFEYYGVDISESLCNETQRRVDGHVEAMNALDMRFRDNSFDAVVGGAILHHLPEPQAALEEWLRITRQTGDVTVIEPNYLFPKDFVTAHLVDEERHKTMMAPWRIRKTMRATSASRSGMRPCIYTPPWPAACHDWFDSLDERLADSPAKWFSQMLLLQLEP